MDSGGCSLCVLGIFIFLHPVLRGEFANCSLKLLWDDKSLCESLMVMMSRVAKSSPVDFSFGSSRKSFVMDPTKCVAVSCSSCERVSH